MNDELLREALILAASGVPVFPCLENKRQACEHGFKDASVDRATIRALFNNSRAVIIGYPTGAASGIDVLDVDIGKGGEKWDRLEGLAEAARGENEAAVPSWWIFDNTAAGAATSDALSLQSLLVP